MNRAVPLGVVTALALTGVVFAISPVEMTDAILNPLGRSDADGDRIPDAVEKELCARPLSRNQLKEAGVGRCADTNDYVPPEEKHIVTLYSGVVLGPDEDRDGLPAYVTLTSNLVVIDPFQSSKAIVRLQPATETLKQTVDANDQDPASPVPTRIEVPTKVPLDFELGKDEDRDGLPSTLTLKWGTLTIDRSNLKAPYSFKAGEEQTVPVDQWDTDPEMPVVSTVALHIPVSVAVSGDADNDLVPGEVRITYDDLSFDRRNVKDLSQAYKGRHTDATALDGDDQDRDNYVGLTAIDRDVDFIPDAVEEYICMVQSEATPDDGKCVAADGQGADGSGKNYVAPAGGVRNPWNTHG